MKFEWEPVYYIGNLVTLHRLNVYAAYSLRGNLPFTAYKSNAFNYCQIRHVMLSKVKFRNQNKSWTKCFFVCKLKNLLIGKSGGVVRIINRKTAERALLKDLTGKVVDIAFAYTDDVILAAVDEVGNLLVHSVREGDDKKIQYPCIENCVHVIPQYSICSDLSLLKKKFILACNTLNFQ